MFNCASCKKSIGPNVKPTVTVTGTRNRDYTNTITVLDEYEREQKKTINSSGMEITSTIMQCNVCAGIPEPMQAPVPEAIRKLNRKPFEEPLAPPLRPKLVAVSCYNALTRTEHKSRRAKTECELTIPVIKRFIDDNPKYVF